MTHTEILFEDQLHDAILATPIVYISTIDYHFVANHLIHLLTTRKRTPVRVRQLAFYNDSEEYDGCCYSTQKEDAISLNDFVKYRGGEATGTFLNLLRELLSNEPKMFAANQKDEDGKIILGHKIFVVNNAGRFLLGNDEQQQRTVSALQEYVTRYRNNAIDASNTLFLISAEPITQIPLQLRDIVSVIEMPMPNDDDIMELIKQNFQNSEDSKCQSLARTLSGLQFYEVEQVLSKISKCSGRSVGDNTNNQALKEKQRIVKRSGIIEVVPTNVRLSDVGGLDNLKKEIQNKAYLFKHLEVFKQQNEYRIPLPKGLLILGMPGCGKSMIAKAIANEFAVSLLRLDVNRLMGQYVGMSEENLRRALHVAEMAHPCVLWIDEVEKAFAGAGTGSGGSNSDMLVQRLMGQFLTWMQERVAPVYIVATANDVMRPEFMRKGRFDEVYFVDFPNPAERQSIFEAHLKTYGYENKYVKTIYDFSDFTRADVQSLAQKMIPNNFKFVDDRYEKGFEKGFSGAEIKYIVDAVMEKYVRIYLDKIETLKEQGSNQTPSRIKVLAKDFLEQIAEVEKNCMVRQQIDKTEQKTNPFLKTNLDRIRDVKLIYKFKDASKK